MDLPFLRFSAPPGGPEEPIRAELFSTERLEQHAESLAMAQQAGPGRGRPLRGRVEDNGRVLLACYRATADAIREERAISPAAEWLVDNFHIVEEQVREVRADLPTGFYRQLPKLVEGPLAGYPRVYGIAWAYVAHLDSRFDPEALRRFVAAYQEVQPLTIGELWAVAISLRIMLIENLRRLAEAMVQGREARREADSLADAFLGLGDRSPEAALASMQRFQTGALPVALVVQLLQRLREQDPATTPALRWLTERFEDQGPTFEEIVNQESQRQAALNVTVRNVITSMRLVSKFDWAGFFEEVSLVDQELAVTGEFGILSFATRNRYRDAVEVLARQSGKDEIEIARLAAGKAEAARQAGLAEEWSTARLGDPGYYLISRGRRGFERELGYRARFSRKLLRAYVRGAIVGYPGSIVALTAALLAVPLLLAADAPPWQRWVLGMLSLVPASDLAVGMVNRVVAMVLEPRKLPRLALPDGPPAELRTLIAVPTLLVSPAQIEEQVRRIEIHYLANQDGEFRFALLTDWTDAPDEEMPGDQQLVEAAAAGVAALNGQYGPAPGGDDRFLLFHRRRLWNEGERRYLGWERKRGKLHELNRLLRGASDTTFMSTPAGHPLAPPDVRYVITLDADTRLPAGVATQLVGIMAHPLHRPVFDETRGRVVDGYGVLQPRVTPTLARAGEGSIFQRIYSGQAGVDPYASAVSDVYQDLFGEGSYTGKGIYDVDAFEAALAGRVPESALLSHDLFEGTFARAGLVTDLELFEDFPSHYEVAASRQHRWARGDWQLLPWILGRAPQSRGPWGLNRLGRWKMLDNLRRSVSAPATVLVLIVAWSLPSASPLVWTVLMLAAVAAPSFLPVLGGVLRITRPATLATHLRAVRRETASAGLQFGLAVAMLAHQAWIMADAILRSLWRLYGTRRRLLAWVTAAQATADVAGDQRRFRRVFGPAAAIAAVAAVPAALGDPQVWPLAIPVVVSWALSPAVARLVSLPYTYRVAGDLSTEQVATLRMIGRRTWRFFEMFVGAEDNHLPPDNFQEDPSPVVAHRTSPTNIGLYLLTTVAANDFGWIGTLDAADRLERTFGTVARLEHFRGHLFNWYDTQDLRPLEPRYVSTVDSGNLAGHLLAIAQACRGALDRPPIGPAALAGIHDTARLVWEAALELTDDRRTQIVTRRHLGEALEAVTARLESVPVRPAEWLAVLDELAAAARQVADIARTLAAGKGEGGESAVVVWSEALLACVTSHTRDLQLLCPWAGAAATILDELNDAPANEREQLEHLVGQLPTPAEGADRCREALADLESLRAHLLATQTLPATVARLGELSESLTSSAEAYRELARRLVDLGAQAGEIFDKMEFGFLFDESFRLFSIGYLETDARHDPGVYDLFASEARLASFVAIARGEVPPSHWFRLGRVMTPVEGEAALTSWSGSMFEYLMPALVMESPPDTLLAQTYRLVVERQIEYGAERGVPWGVSESAYSLRDLHLTYQYSGFGVPGLGFERGLSEDLVVAPYATALAAMIDPVASVVNFGRLAEAGGQGRYGFYESLDFTPGRLPEGEDVVVVRAYMAHHQGMTLVAFANILLDGIMRNRFHTDPTVQAVELLLQERTPRETAVTQPRVEEVKATAHVREVAPPVVRRFDSPHHPDPPVHLLSNGRYSVMMTAAGSGYSRWRDLAVTRWREDRTLDAWGTHIYLRDARRGSVWSAAYQPTAVEPDAYQVTFSEDRAEIFRRDGDIVSTLEVAVSGEDDAEVRRVSLHNMGSQTREIELTSYAEVVMATPAADAAHPVFSNLFVETEAIPALDALLATRRPRSADEPRHWAAHVMSVDGSRIGPVQYETDRDRFVGRGRTARNPLAVSDGRPLSGSVGGVLDPIFSLRVKVRLAPREVAQVTFSTLVAPSREAARDLADRYHDPATSERAFTSAWTQAQVHLHHLGIDADEANLFQTLAGPIVYSGPSLRTSPDVLARNAGGASGLWAYGISGDLPIVLVRIDDPDDRGIVRDLLRAHEYWRTKGLAVDLVVLNEKAPSYAQDLDASLGELMRTRGTWQEGPGGGVFVLRLDRLAEADRDLLKSAARAVLLSRHGTLAEQVARVTRTKPLRPPAGRRLPAPTRAATPPLPSLDLDYFNGLGGFSKDGTEYVTAVGEGQWTPAPWINVIANPAFGFQVSESGSGPTWSLNSRQNRLTPWSNDPVSDPPGEVVYVRDEDTGEIWGPTALPVREESSPYLVRHGLGYSRFQHSSHGVSLELTQFVAPDDPVKISRLTIDNHSGRPRKLSVTGYVEWVLGVARDVAAPFIVTEIDPTTGALLANNPWNTDFAGRVAFLDLAGRQTSWTGDRGWFLGRDGRRSRPAGLERGPLSGTVGAGLDPCGALQTVVELPTRGHAEVVILLGEGADRPHATELVSRYRGVDFEALLQQVVTGWDDLIGALQVTTPDRSMDLMLNRWYLYQTLACRVWGRSALYQSGGAFGFRDQLQDVMALTVPARRVTRQHLLVAAGRQFKEGDVQHWWHPETGVGVRTRISDDLLWLPYAVAHYLEAIDDAGVLDEMVPFLEGPPLEKGQDEAYFRPQVSAEEATVFEHCARAIDHSLRVGAHGLPLIGTGDWNDGMNKVGVEGKGESVWLGWFLHAVLDRFVPLAEYRGETARVGRWRRHREALRVALEREGWDGDWYRRAFFDDGTPLGSASNSECRIDSIAQSWAVLHGGATRERAERAMASVEAYLVRKGDGLILLFTPPFDGGKIDPGYVKGYLPGVRENGGQYTHAAAWAVAAFATLGDGDRAYELYSILNPINQTGSRAGIHRYKVEPYVAAADIYSEPPHVGRGGWTWYTGSASWMYRVGIEWILGFRLRGETLHLDPCIPRAWRGYEMRFRYHSSRYEITVQNPAGRTRGVVVLELDGEELEGGAAIPLVDDGTVHQIRAVLG